jgi:hypothetical protein
MRVKLLFVLVLLSLVGISGQTVAQKSSRGVQGAPDETNIVVLQPEPADTEAAAKQGVQVFKLLPRGMHDYENNAYGLRGGGAYYSFANTSHSYNMTPQVELSRSGEFNTGFAGADYGFIYDIGDVELSAVDTKLPNVKFLNEYRPPLYEPDVRKEQRKALDGTDGYKSRSSALAGHTYVLRNISFREADTLVAFRVERINDDGSAIVFWKSIKSFEVPKLLYLPDSELKAKVDEILKDIRYAEISCEVKDNRINLRGKVAREDYMGLMSAVQKENRNGIANDIRLK